MDKCPPYNVEAELSALGSCLLENEAIDEVAAILSPADWYRDTHREVWLAIVTIQASGEPVDAVTLADYLIKADRFTSLGGDGFLADMVNAVPHAANARYYAQIVREKAVARRLIEAAEETLKDCYRAQKTASELQCDAEQRVFAVGDHDSNEVVSMEEMVDESMALLETRIESDISGAATGFEDLDDLTGGLQPGELTILAARPSQGKTALALEFADALAAAGEPVLFVSLEMGRQALMDRIISSRAEVDSYVYQRPRMLKEHHRARIRQEAARLITLPIHFDWKASRTVNQIASSARRLKRRHGLGLIVIDYLSLIDGQREKGDNRQEEVARISRGLKAMARSLSVPVVCLCQLNREIEKRSEKRPLMADLRESGQIEADADVILLLHRPESYDANDQPGVAELWVAKNRNGPTGIVRLLFQKAFTRFHSFATVAEPLGNRGAF